LVWIRDGTTANVNTYDTDFWKAIIQVTRAVMIHKPTNISIQVTANRGYIDNIIYHAHTRFVTCE